MTNPDFALEPNESGERKLTIGILFILLYIITITILYISKS